MKPTFNVQRGHHLFALEHTGCDGGRQKISREDQKRRSAFIGDAPFDRRHTREAADVVHRCGLVDVVDLQEGDGCVCARRARFLLLSERAG
jgi:hypothetical protein